MRPGGASARRCCRPCWRRGQPSLAEASRCSSLQRIVEAVKSLTGLLDALPGAWSGWGFQSDGPLQVTHMILYVGHCPTEMSGCRVAGCLSEFHGHASTPGESFCCSASSEASRVRLEGRMLRVARPAGS